MENASKPFDVSRLSHHHHYNRSTATAVTFHTPTATLPAAEGHLQRHRYGLDFDNHNHDRETLTPSSNFRVPLTCLVDPELGFLSPPLFGANSGPSPLSLSESELETESGSEFVSDSSSDVDGYGDGYDDVGEDDDEEDDCDYADGNLVSFATDLLESSVRNPDLGLGLGLAHVSDDMDYSDYSDCRTLCEELVDGNSEVDLELGLSLGFGDVGELGRNSSSSIEPKPSEFSSVFGEESRSLGGLREVGIDSDSDSEENVVFNGQYGFEIDDFDEIERMDAIDEFNDQPLFCSYFGLNIDRQYSILDFESEEGDLVAGPEVLLEGSSIFTDRVRNDNDLFNHWDHSRDDDGEASVRSATEEEEMEFGDGLEQAIQDLEWEILHAVNNFNRELDDSMFGVVEESLNECRGNPPASKSVIERLPLVNLSMEEIKEHEIACAICKVDILVEEQVRKLPCQHYYHGDCIIPWLGIRNTCPVCRFELPTDDPEYEFRKRESSGQIDDDDGDEFSEDLQMNYANFHVFL